MKQPIMRLAAAAVAAVAAPAPARAQAPPAAQAVPAEIWLLDQVRLPSSIPMETLMQFQPDHTMAAVVERLTRLGIGFSRMNVSLLADRLPPSVRDKIVGLPAGEPFVIPSGDLITINVLLGRKPAPGAAVPAPLPAPPTAPLKRRQP